MGKLSTMQDMELVALLKEDSQLAFSELYTRYKDQLLYSCKKYLKNETAAEDIVQDIFMQIWETRHSLHIISSFSGFLYTAAQNRILNIYRQMDVHSRFARYILDNDNELSKSNEIENFIIEKEYMDILNKLIDTLPPMQKSVSRLNWIEGLTNKEISEKLNISVENVRKHTSLALKKIITKLSKHTNIDIQTVILFMMFFS